MKKLLLFVGLTLAVAASCSKNEQPDNPFPGNGNGGGSTDTLDPYTIQGIHAYILSTKCANPTCHDGTFEPDFRTIESSYQSLVYHPVIKNDAQGSYTYRVVPGNLAESWLHERLITGDPVLGRMPLYAPPLSAEEMNWIVGWIQNGAPNQLGIPATYPNSPPTVEYYFALDAANNRLDTTRVNGWASPFIAPTGTTFNLLFSVKDDSTASSALTNVHLKVSTSPDHFSTATTVPAVWITSTLWSAPIQTALFPGNVPLYFRAYAQDDDLAQTEFPAPSSPYYYKQNASFIIQ